MKKIEIKYSVWRTLCLITLALLFTMFGGWMTFELVEKVFQQEDGFSTTTTYNDKGVTVTRKYTNQEEKDPVLIPFTLFVVIVTLCLGYTCVSLVYNIFKYKVLLTIDKDGCRFTGHFISWDEIKGISEHVDAYSEFAHTFVRIKFKDENRTTKKWVGLLKKKISQRDIPIRLAKEKSSYVITIMNEYLQKWNSSKQPNLTTMKYEIKALKSVGSFIFNERREIIHKLLRIDIKNTFEETYKSQCFIVDDYDGILAYYNKDNLRLFYVLFVPYKSIELLFDNQNLFMLPSSEIYKILKKHDANIFEENYVGFGSMKLGIDISSPSYIEDKEVKCEAISVAIKGYFDCIYDDGSELNINELQDNLS